MCVCVCVCVCVYFGYRTTKTAVPMDISATNLVQVATVNLSPCKVIVFAAASGPIPGRVVIHLHLSGYLFIFFIFNNKLHGN